MKRSRGETAATERIAPKTLPPSSEGRGGGREGMEGGREGGREDEKEGGGMEGGRGEERREGEERRRQNKGKQPGTNQPSQGGCPHPTYCRQCMKSSLTLCGTISECFTLTVHRDVEKNNNHPPIIAILGLSDKLHSNA